MESLGYILLYFFRGHLPWQKLKEETKQQKYKLIIEKKAIIGIGELYDKVPRGVCGLYGSCSGFEI
jgi:hypothetical protein